MFPKFLLVLLVFVFFSALAQGNTTTISDPDYEKALDTYNEGDYQTAYIHLKNSLHNHPDSLAAKILMGKVLFETGYINEAEVELQESLTLGGDPNLIIDSLGSILLIQEKYEEILKTEFTNLTQNNQNTWNLVNATANLNLGRVDNARSTFIRLTKTDPLNISVFNGLANLELRENNLSEGKKYIEQAMLLSAENFVTWRIKGDIALAEDDLQTAISSYNKGISLSANDPFLLRNLATAYLRDSQFELASQTVETVLGITPEDPMAILMQSWLQLQTQDATSSIMTLESLTNMLSGLPEEISAQTPDFLFLDGVANYAQGNLEAARKLLIQYINNSKGNFDAVRILVDIHTKMGDKQIALDLLEGYPQQLEQDISMGISACRLYLTTNRTHRAISLLDKLRVNFPNHPDVVQMHAQILAHRGKVDEAIAVLNATPSLANTAAFILTRGTMQFEQKNYTAALEEAEALLKIDANHQDFLNFKAAVLVKLKLWDAANTVLDKVLAIAPNHFSARFNKATALAGLGLFADANEVIQTLLTEKPNDSATNLLLARIERDTGAPELALKRVGDLLRDKRNNSAARSLFIDLLIEQQDFSRALVELKTLAKSIPHGEREIEQKATIHQRQGEFELAAKELNKLHLAWQAQPSKLYQLGLRQKQIQDISGAKRSFNTLIEMSPNSFWPKLELAKIEIEQGNFAAAKKLTAAINKTSPDNANVFLLLGDIALAEGKASQASKAYTQAITASPTFIQALVKLYQLTLSSTGVDGFAATVEPIIKQNPDFLFHRHILADFYLNQKELANARRHYEAVAEKEDYSNLAPVLNNLANILLLLGETEKSFATAERSYALAPNNAATVDTYGWLLAKQNKLEEALKVLRNAYAMKSSDPAIQYHLGYTLYKLNKKSEAKTQLEKALVSGQDFIGREQAQALLESM